MKPTAHRVRKLVEGFEKDYMNKVLPMLDPSEVSDPEIVVQFERVRDGVYDFHKDLRDLYALLAEPKQ